ncbi:MAG: VOC family protein [Solirubrobacteraceae bacterium]
MPDTADSIQISQVGTVFVPVADQDRALAFYTGKLGFEKRADFRYGEDHRWVEVAPAGSALAIALVPPSEGRIEGGEEAHCAFAVEDIEAVHAELRARGVEFLAGGLPRLLPHGYLDGLWAGDRAARYSTRVIRCYRLATTVRFIPG